MVENGVPAENLAAASIATASAGASRRCGLAPISPGCSGSYSVTSRVVAGLHSARSARSIAAGSAAWCSVSVQKITSGGAGSAIGANNAQASAAGLQRTYDINYAQCMAASGEKVPDMTGPGYPPPPYPAGYVAPPPPAYGYAYPAYYGPDYYYPPVEVGIGFGYDYRYHRHW